MARAFKVIAVTGPRQSGKTTLCKMAFPDYAYFNLDRLEVVEEIEKSPAIFLQQYGKNGVIYSRRIVLRKVTLATAVVS
ncbi:hypothetical protein FACS1894108_15070 [Planctomycetales bacterium]|nr:hypothetical protein FACS1894108_15070 [Planctomycetales bacterium]